MKDMLPDNMALLRQLDNFSADKSTSKAKLREIKTFTTWLYCFTAYMAVQTSDPHTRELLTYTPVSSYVRHSGLVKMDS